MNTNETPSPSVEAACSAIREEVARATIKFPTWPTDPLHAFGVVGEEFGELQKEVLQLNYEPHKSSKEAVRKEAVQLAAMAVRFLMSLDRYDYRPGVQHSQAHVEGMCQKCGDRLCGHEDENGTHCRWCSVGWAESSGGSASVAATPHTSEGLQYVGMTVEELERRTGR